MPPFCVPAHGEDRPQRSEDGPQPGAGPQLDVGQEAARAPARRSRALKQ